MRTYEELMRLPTFLERFKYLRLQAAVEKETFGFERSLNQRFYHSSEWRRIRNQIIVRDLGCDLAMSDREIRDKVYIHHMNPITTDDIVHSSDFLTNPNYLICCSYDTHQAIHYGDENLLLAEPITRAPNDTCPWKQQ